MEFSGKIIAVLPLVTGTGRNGEWRKQEYVIESHDQYPKKMCFNVWSDKIDQFAIQAGEELIVSFDIDSREYNGRWYNDIRAWKVERVAQNAPQGAPYAQQASQAVPPPPMDFAASDSNDDLPF